MALYLVTGGCGFIGAQLCAALLARGDSVRVLDDLSTGRRDRLAAEVELIIGDVADAALLRQAMQGVAGCFHLAAIASVQRSVEDWPGVHRVNLGGTIAVFDAARAAGPVPVVYASSAAVYGDNPAIPLAEILPARPLTAYGADKYAAELHALAGWHVHHLPSTGLRIFNAYGPGQEPHSPYAGVIAIFAARLAAGQAITIHGDGGQARDFIYIDDVVRHLLAAMQAHPAAARVFNVCTGHATTILHLAQSLGGILGREPVLNAAPCRAGDILASVGDPTAAQAGLGLRADTTLAQGLQRLLAAPLSV